MALSRPISDEDLYLLPLIKLVTSVGRDLMFEVFSYGCPNKDQNKNLKVYLEEVKPADAIKLMKMFNKTMTEQVIANPRCDQLDVPLLFLAIKVACNNVADFDSPDWYTKHNSKLEFLLKQLKDERNQLLHKLPKITKEDIKPKIELLRTLLIKIIETTFDRFSLDSSLRQQKLKELNDHVDQVRDQPLTKDEILKYKDLWLREYIENTLKVSGGKELKEVFSKLENINPLPFLVGYNTQISLQEYIFQLSLEHFDDFNKKSNVDLNNVLQVGRSASDEKASFILVRGEAGSGKTLLTNWLMYQWSKKDDLQVPSLAEYDLVIPIECWSQRFDSLLELFKSLLPNTCPALGEHIITYIQNLKILFILDGWDEVSSKSRKVVGDILQLSRARHHTILCTSRPKKSRDFPVPDQYHKSVFNIVGILPGEQGNFVRKFHDLLVSNGKSVQTTDSLVQFVNKSRHLQNLFQRPLILSLVVYLWACQPDRLNKNTTDTDLYHLLYHKLEGRVRQRVLPLIMDDSVDTDEKLKELIAYFSVEALNSLDLNQGMSLPSPKNIIKSLLSHEDILLFQELPSMFLSFSLIEEPSSSTGQFHFPSDDCHNYFAAKGLLNVIRNDHIYSVLKQTLLPAAENVNLKQEYVENVTSKTIIRNTLKVVTKGLLEITKYKNVLFHLVGLLGEKHQDVTDNEAWELVQLLTDVGIRTQNAWLKFLTEVNCAWQVKQIVANLYFRTDKHLVIKTADVAGMSSLLPHLSPDLVILDLPGELDDLDHLNQLLDCLTKMKCDIVVNQWRDLINPDLIDITDPKLLRLFHQDVQCRVIKSTDKLCGCMVFPGHTCDVMTAAATTTQHQYSGTNWFPEITNEVMNTSPCHIVTLEPIQSAVDQIVLNDEQLSLVCEDGELKTFLVRESAQPNNENPGQFESGKSQTEEPTRCFVLLGETGAGKTTFVSSVLNYQCNISFDDNYRFCVEDQKTDNRSSTESQTDCIVVYKIPHKIGMRHDCDIVIIDTPGLADTRGEEQQATVMQSLEEFFMFDQGIDDLHCLGLVANATVNRCTSFQKDVIDNVMSLLGNHIPDITNIIASHATEKPKVDQVIRQAGVQYSKIYGFDNHVVFASNRISEDVDDVDFDMLKLRWKKMLKQYTQFFSELLEGKSVSVRVLREKKRLDKTLRLLWEHAKLLDSKWTEIEKLEKELSNHNLQENKMKEYKQEYAILSTLPGRHSHNCDLCGQICEFCLPAHELKTIIKKEDEDDYLPACIRLLNYSTTMLGEVSGVNEYSEQLNRALCSFTNDPCSHCGCSLSNHSEVTLKNESVKELFDKAVLKKEETMESTNKVNLEINDEKDQVVRHFLYIVVLFKTVEKFSSPQEVTPTLDLVEQLISEVSHEHNHYAMAIIQQLKEILHIFDDCPEDKVINMYDTVMSFLEEIAKTSSSLLIVNASD